MKDHPENIRGSRICIYISPSGIKFYGNREAFQSLVNWMKRNAESNPSDYYECHLHWDMLTPKALEGEEPPNIWVLYDKRVAPLFLHLPDNEDDLEVIFMVVSDQELDGMEQYKESKIAPESWYQK